MIKPKILIITDYYLPGYKAGGVLRSVTNLVISLNDHFNFSIITSDHDLTERVPYENITSNTWNKRSDDHNVFYLSRGIKSFLTFFKLLRHNDFDLLYINGFFSPKFSIFVILLSKLGFISRKSILLAPKGEFSEGALKIKKIKKMLFLIFSKVFGLHKDINWHASTKYEKDDILRTIGKVNIYEAVDIIVMDSRNYLEREDLYKKIDHLKIVFISRISPKKNLDYAAKLLSKIESQIKFNIYRPIDDQNYWEKCLDLFKNLPNNIELKYHGSIHPNEIYHTMSKHHVFLFPTHGENFGYVIAEALEAGCIPIISDKTPWDDLQEKSIGKIIPLGDDLQYIKSIDYFAKMDNQTFKLASQAAKKYILSPSRLDESINKNKKIFDTILNSNL